MARSWSQSPLCLSVRERRAMQGDRPWRHDLTWRTVIVGTRHQQHLQASRQLDCIHQHAQLVAYCLELLQTSALHLQSSQAQSGMPMTTACASFAWRGRQKWFLSHVGTPCLAALVLRGWLPKSIPAPFAGVGSTNTSHTEQSSCRLNMSCLESTFLVAASLNWSSLCNDVETPS